MAFDGHGPGVRLGLHEADPNSAAQASQRTANGGGVYALVSLGGQERQAASGSRSPTDDRRRAQAASSGVHAGLPARPAVGAMTTPIDSLKLLERNPRRITADAFGRLCDSIRRDPQFMRLRPIVVDDDNNILGGNMRWRACKEIGMTELPEGWVVKASGLTAEQRKRFVLIDNAPEGMAGSWDDDILAADFEIPDLQMVGFPLGELGMFDADEKPPPSLASGDRQPFRQMTFTVHDEQFEEIEAAMRLAKKAGHGESAVNENGNGNALAWVCQFFNRNNEGGDV